MIIFINLVIQGGLELDFRLQKFVIFDEFWPLIGVLWTGFRDGAPEMKV